LPEAILTPATNGNLQVLDSWKEIAAFLRRSVRTVQRWERDEGLPVRRHHHMKRGSVFALASDLAAWQRIRQAIQHKHAVPHAMTAAKMDELKKQMALLMKLTSAHVKLMQEGKKLAQMHEKIESLVSKLD
jgi:phage terminase Nu1 subunit (DNA packaging protein)